MSQPYKRPPITEAVIAVGIKSPLDETALDKIHKRLLEKYPAPVQRVISQFDIEITASGPQVKGSQQAAYKMTSGDAADTVLLFPGQLITSRLAPYEGWESLSDRARSNWEDWKKIVGWRAISRVGVRYVNRIDIPTPTEPSIELDDYLTVSPRMPTDAGLPPMNQFAVNTVAPIGIDGCRLILNVASTPSPLVKTASFVLDIDVAVEHDPPQNEDAIWDLLNRIRGHKNNIFESCLTPRTRALFS